MPEPRYPGADWLPGAKAGYKAGRTPVRSVVAHYTVGVSSTGIGLRGYFQFLVHRDGTVTQFAETDAVCWHAGNPWNMLGPGIEIEYHPADDPTIFTDAQVEACGRLVRWLHTEWLVPLKYHDGERIPAWQGFIAHRSLIQTGDQHHDYWPRTDWDRMVTPEGGGMALLVHKQDEPQAAFLIDGGVQIGVAIDQFKGQPGVLYVPLANQAQLDQVLGQVPSAPNIAAEIARLVKVP